MPDPATCPSCGSPLPTAARFCPACGRELGPSAPEEERRVVTVLFADVAGFTSLAEGRDPESVKELLDSCFGALVPIVEQLGGHVDKIIGDELMAVFGAPTAHQDDPERAVRAALDLGPALRLAAPGLVLRVGVNTGEVLAGPVGPGGAYTVTGDTVNTAHRLVQAAEPGEVLVGERTWEATGSVVVYEHRAPYALRGKQELVPAWAAKRVRAALPGVAPASGAPLEGRAAELDELERIVGPALARRETTVVALSGEPGVGKTRLAHALVDRLTGVGSAPITDGVLPPALVSVRCRPFGARRHVAAVADVVRAALDLDPTAPRDVQRAALAARVPPVARRSGADAEVLHERLSRLLGLTEQTLLTSDAGAPRGRPVDDLFAAARLVLISCASAGPVVVLIDDLQWADPSLFGFVERLPLDAPDLPLAVLAVGREGAFERRSADAARGQAVSIFPVGPLDAAATRAVLHAQLARVTTEADQAAPPPVAVGPATEARLLEAAGGNPLLIEELVQYLRDTGGLVWSDEQWQLAGPDHAVGLPDGIRSLLWARLDALPAAERRLLLDASVVGSRFWFDAVTALEPEHDAVTLRALIGRGLVEEVHDQGDGELGFRHRLTRDVAYASVSMGDRAHKHAILAGWLADRFPEPREGIVVGVLAQHVEQAVRLNHELEHTVPGLAASAFRALLAAAQEAERFEARHDAERWYRRALDLGTADRELRTETLVAHARTLVHLGRLDDARQSLEDAALTVDPDSKAGGEVLTWLAVVARLQGDLEAARAGFDQAQHRQRAAGDRLGQAITLRLQGWSELLAGRPRAALPRLRQAAGLLRDGDPVGERGETLRCLGWCGFLVGDPAARGHLETAASLLSEAGDPGGATWCVGILGFSHLQRGDIESAIEVAELLLERARERGDSWGMATCTLLLAAARLEHGDLRRAAGLAESAARRFAELDDAWGQAMSALLQGMASRASGDVEASRAHLMRGLAIAPRVAYVGEESRLLSELARLELDAGDLAEATRRARSSLALVRSGVGEVDSEVRALHVLAEVALAEDDRVTAQLLLEQAVETGLHAVGQPRAEETAPGLTERDLASNATRQAAARLSQLLCGWGDTSTAAELLDLAAAGSQASAPTRVATARARAAALADSGRTAEAAAVLGEVLDAYADEDFAFLAPLEAWRASLATGP